MKIAATPKRLIRSKSISGPVTSSPSSEGLWGTIFEISGGKCNRKQAPILRATTDALVLEMESRGVTRVVEGRKMYVRFRVLGIPGRVQVLLIRRGGGRLPNERRRGRRPSPASIRLHHLRAPKVPRAFSRTRTQVATDHLAPLGEKYFSAAQILREELGGAGPTPGGLRRR